MSDELLNFIFLIVLLFICMLVNIQLYFMMQFKPGLFGMGVVFGLMCAACIVFMRKR